MEFLVALGISALTGLLVVELYVWLPKVSEKLLRIAIKRLPEPDKERCLEEWSAALAALPNTVVRLWHAASFIVAARTIRADAIASGELMAEVLSNHSVGADVFANLRNTFDKLTEDHLEMISHLPPKHQRTVRQLERALLTAKRQAQKASDSHDRAGVYLRSAAAKYFRFLELREGMRKDEKPTWMQAKALLSAAIGGIVELVKAWRVQCATLRANENCHHALKTYSDAVKTLPQREGPLRQA